LFIIKNINITKKKTYTNYFSKKLSAFYRRQQMIRTFLDSKFMITFKPKSVSSINCES